MAAFDYLNQTPEGAPAATTPASTTESTNAQQRTQVLGKIADTLDAGNTDQTALLDDIAAAITSDIIGGSTGSTDNRVLISKGTGGRALEASGVTADTSGNINTNGGDITCDDITCDDIGADAITANSGAFANTLTRGGNNVAIATQTIGVWSGVFKSPEDETLFIILNVPFAVTITQTNTITEVGTSTVTVFNNGVGDLSSNSASTSTSTVAQSVNNVVAIGGAVGVTFASTSSDCENLCLTIWGTRVLAS